MRSWSLLIAPMAIVVGICAVRAITPRGEAAQPSSLPVALAPSLPVRQVVLYSSGIGHFQREGSVEGDARIEMAFPAADVNDLLKSLDIEDLGGGVLDAIVYDNPDPMERTLQTFSLDLTANPSLGELLNQARGERVRATLADGNAAGLEGNILGMEERNESSSQGAVAVDQLNLWQPDGVRSLPLKQVRTIKFLNPRLDADLQRAFALMANGRDGSKKTVAVTSRGAGRRAVRVGYMAETPVWKASYRLNVGADGVTRLQGWALVENTTDEDWTDVRMTLAAGRPVAFKMDLYPPLFAPRPLVEPKQFAALRPPTYAGPVLGGVQGGNAFLGGGLGFQGGTNNANLGFGGGTGGGQSIQGGRYQRSVPLAQASLIRETDDPAAAPVTFEKYRQRLVEMTKRAEVATDDPAAQIASLDDEPVGEPARYALAAPLTLPRHKSALVSFVSKPVDASTVSIYSPEVHPRLALKAVRVKNGTGMPIVAGPVTIRDRDGYAGDARIAHWPAGEERFLAYALDLGCEVKRSDEATSAESTAVKIVRGKLSDARRIRVTTTYDISPRAGGDRTLWLEQPAEAGWTLVSPEKADERSRNRYRFRVAVPAGQGVNRKVIVERQTVTTTPVGDLGDATVRAALALPVASVNVKKALESVLQSRQKLATIRGELADRRAALTAAGEEQSRLRTNLEAAPATSELHKRYLEKLGSVETTVEKLRDEIAERTAKDKTLQLELQQLSENLSAE